MMEKEDGPELNSSPRVDKLPGALHVLTQS